MVPSRAEETTTITTTPSALVQYNARIKAEEVASRTKEAIVIGADTAVYIGHKEIILKPKNLNEAKRKLKVLFSRPHWVYTGVCVIDSLTGKNLLSYEKTKVFMSPLTEEQIGRYHQRVSPLDKAGGFDIEGLGSVFIHRIEGCYTNVIGLPMARLFRMLQEMGVSVL